MRARTLAALIRSRRHLCNKGPGYFDWPSDKQVTREPGGILRHSDGRQVGGRSGRTSCPR